VPQTTRPVIETHRLQLIELARRRGIGNVRVFGSLARDDAGDNSDVDFLVTLPRRCSGLALGGLLMHAQDLLSRPVDVVTEDGLQPAIREAALALRESDKFTDWPGRKERKQEVKQWLTQLDGQA